MKEVILMVCVAFLSVMPINTPFAFAAGQNVADWRQKLVDANIPDLQKTLYADSILMTGPTDSLDLKLTLAELLAKVGYYGRAADVRKSILKSNSEQLSEEKRLAVKAALARDLVNREDLIGAVSICKEILQSPHCESALQEAGAAYSVLQYISIRTSHNDAGKYLEKGKSLLEKARKEKYPPREIEEINRLVTRMQMSELLSKNRFNEFFRLADSVMAQPMSNTDRLQVDLLWAYAHMLNGEDDMAIEKYRRIVDKPVWNVRQGEALLNLTYLLMEHKKYEEALALINAKSSIIDLIPKDSYVYLSLQDNKAIALNATGHDKEAFPIVRAAFEDLGDLYYKTLMVNVGESIDSDLYPPQFRQGEEKKSGAVIWVLAVLLAVSVALCLLSFIRSSRQRRQLEEAKRRIAEIDRQGHKEVPDMLQLAQVNETIELIRELVRDKTASDTDKLKSISTALSVLAPQTELWEIFRINFEQVHSGFFSRLYASHPDLTPIEMRMCAYLVMNLSSKEIAALTNRSLRSVESIRYRLNRKIVLPKDMNLVTYLRQFISS